MRRWMLLFILVGLALPALLAAQEVPADALSPFDANSLQLLIQARSDLELLANDRLGAVRPPLWSGSQDIYNPELARLLRLDLELLAGTLLAPEQRPPGWFGPVRGTSLVFARDIRHDLELLADTVIQPNVRPGGWVGGDPLLRCDRAVQSLVSLLERSGFILPLNASTPDFCAQAELQAAQFAEANPAVTFPSAAPAQTSGAAAASGAPVAPPGSARITGELALGFLNRYATEHIGLIPVGTIFTPVARSFTEFSRMMLIRGEGFELFIDHRDSTVTDAEFAGLPDVNGVSVNTLCEVEWCRPVTYTVGSPAARRPLPPLPGTASVVSAATTPNNRIKVPVEHLIIYYDGQDADGTTVVRMQLCAKPTGQPGNTCQNVTQVIAPGGAALVSVGNVNGIAQFRLPYNYSAHTLYAAAYYMTDVWIAAPGQRR